VVAHEGGVLGHDVVRPVLEALQVARGDLGAARRRRSPEPELEPAHDDRAPTEPGQVAHRVEGDLRVVGAGLDRQVAAAPRRLEEVAGEAGQLGQGGRPPASQPEAIVEQPGPEADCHGQPPG
jgi:hypothetical protein